MIQYKLDEKKKDLQAKQISLAAGDNSSGDKKVENGVIDSNAYKAAVAIENARRLQALADQYSETGYLLLYYLL